MATVLVQNLTQYKLAVPRTNVTLRPYSYQTITLEDIDPFYNDPKIQELMAASPRGPAKINVTLMTDSIPGPVAPPYAAIDRPKVTDVPIGYMVFNTTSGQPNWSDGTNWVDGSGNIDP